MYEVRLTREAEEDFKALDARWRATVSEALRTYLAQRPKAVGKSRIKKLRELRLPQYRLRVDKMQIYYDVFDDYVMVYAIVPKSEAAHWLSEHGEREDDQGTTK